MTTTLTVIAIGFLVIVVLAAMAALALSSSPSQSNLGEAEQLAEAAVHEANVKAAKEADAAWRDAPEYRLVRNKVTCKVRVQRKTHSFRYREFWPRWRYEDIPDPKQFPFSGPGELPPLEFNSPSEALDYLDQLEAERIIKESWTEVLSVLPQGKVVSPIDVIGSWEPKRKEAPPNEGQLVLADPPPPCDGADK